MKSCLIESVIYCGVEGHPPPNYTTIQSGSKVEMKNSFLTRNYFPYWKNEDRFHWSSGLVADFELRGEFNLTCVASVGNESISVASDFSALNRCYLY